MKKIKCLFCLVLLFIFSGNAWAQPPLQPAAPANTGIDAGRLARIDNIVQQYIDSQWIAGATAIVARNGRIVYHKAFGYSHWEKKTPSKTDDIFRIASQTKAVTSVAVMMLYEEGKFLLDDPLSKYIPAFRQPQVIDSFNMKDTSFTTVKAKREVTIRDLLTHTSGIGYAQIGSARAKAMYAKAGVYSMIGVPEMSLREQVMKLAALPLEHQPGERFTYGLNSDVLGYLVEVLSGVSLADFMRTRIFEPLGMQDTWFYLPKDKQARLVALHTENKDRRIMVMERGPAGNFDNLDLNYPQASGKMYSGGAGLVSTALDYAIFMQMMLNGGIYNGKRLLSKYTVNMMTRNQIGSIDRNPNEKFGLGFGILTEQGNARLGMPPGTFSWGGAFSSTYWIDPTEKIVAQLFLNQYPNTHGDLHDKFKVMVYSAIEQ